MYPTKNNVELAVDELNRLGRHAWVFENHASPTYVVLAMREQPADFIGSHEELSDMVAHLTETFTFDGTEPVEDIVSSVLVRLRLTE